MTTRIEERCLIQSNNLSWKQNNGSYLHCLKFYFERSFQNNRIVNIEIISQDVILYFRYFLRKLLFPKAYSWLKLLFSNIIELLENHVIIYIIWWNINTIKLWTDWYKDIVRKNITGIRLKIWFASSKKIKFVLIQNMKLNKIKKKLDVSFYGGYKFFVVLRFVKLL